MDSIHLASTIDLVVTDVINGRYAESGELDNHEEDFANPHKVTAVQVDADPAGSAAAVQANLDALEVTLWPDLDMDFTGTDYDTKAKCQAGGMLFSDSDSPFPSEFVGKIVNMSDGFSHVTGNGWQPSLSADNRGPALMWPVHRSGNWEARINVYLSSSSGKNVYFHFGAVGMGLHTPFYIFNYAYNTIDMRTYMYVNNGDDTYTSAYTGNQVYTSGNYDFYIRSVNGVIQIYDDQNNSWYTHDGVFGAGFGIAHIFLIPYNRAGYTYDTLRLRRFTLKYLP